MIDSRKKKDEKQRLQSLHHLLEDVAEFFIDGVFTLDVHGCFTFINSVIEQRSGFRRNQLIGLHYCMLVTPEYQEQVNHYVELALKGQVQPPLAFRYITPKGEEIYLELNTKPITSADRIIGLIGISRNVTERKIAEQKLQKSEKRFRDIANHAVEWIWEVDITGKYTYVSPVVEKLLGYSPEEVLKKRFYDFFHPEIRDDLKKLALGTFSREENFKDFINKNIHKDGSTVWLSTSGIPVYNEDGKLIGYRGVDINITKQKLIEKKLLTSLREKDILIRETHHRVKNNLQIISSLLKLQAQRIKDPVVIEKFRECQTRIQTMAIIHTKLYQSEEIQVVNFKKYIDSLINYLFSLYGLKNDRVSLEKKIESVNLDLDRAIPCGLLINELLSNAIKHAFPGSQRGSIAILFEKKAKDVYSLVVSDTGVGLSDDIDYEGSKNLGLTLIRALTEQLMGKLDISTSPGTRIEITFPVQPPVSA